jgi:hypothetical protein
MKRKSTVFSLPFVLTLGLAGTAFADGLAVAPAALTPESRASLAKQIAAARAAHPDAFDAVRDVKGYHKETYAKFRNPRPHVEGELRALGSAALLPMIDELVFHAPAKGDDSDADLEALAAGLVDAVGSLRDARSGPVLAAIFATGKPHLVGAAGRGLGKLCGDAELSVLVAHAADRGVTREAAIEGLGECRRIEAARELASLLDAAKTDADAASVAKALGTLGSSWAWATLGAGAEKEGLAVREVVARALVPAFVARTGATRSRIGKSIAMVDHPDLPALLGHARDQADEATRRDLDVLVDVLARKKRAR